MILCLNTFTSSATENIVLQGDRTVTKNKVPIISLIQRNKSRSSQSLFTRMIAQYIIPHVGSVESTHDCRQYHTSLADTK